MNFDTDSFRKGGGDSILWYEEGPFKLGRLVLKSGVDRTDKST